MIKVGKTNMAKNPELYYGPITKSTNWGGDSSTEDKPVAGEVIQQYLKSELSKRVGLLYLDRTSMMYLGFSDQESCDLYRSDPTQYQDLLICSFPASSDYVVQLIIDGPIYRAISKGQTGNYLEFGYQILDEKDNEFVDNINYTVSITRNANRSEFSGVLSYGTKASINIDKYLVEEGQYDIVIQATSLATSAKGSTALTYQVVQLDLAVNYDMTRVFNFTDGSVVRDLAVEYTVFGTTERKYLEWYVDGQLYLEDNFAGGITKPEGATEHIPVLDLSHGIHNFRLRAYVKVNQENFYTDVVYGEFLVIKQADESSVPIIRCTIPKSVEDAITQSPIKLFGLKQYNPYTLNYMVYNPLPVEFTELTISIGDSVSKVSALNKTELAYTYIPYTAGDQELTLSTPNYSRTIGVNIESTPIDLQPITKGLILSLSAIGRTNNDTEVDQWKYGTYSAIFNGFSWTSSNYGWVNDRLVIGEGSSVVINYSPLLDITTGKTIELEFETTNVINDDVVLCDITNEEGFGLIISASQVTLKLGTQESDIVSTKFKSGTNIRVSFVIDNGLGLAYIYVNGHICGAIRFVDETFSVPTPISFVGSELAVIKLKQILVYDNKLSSDQILNNYMLYRDTVEELIDLYEKNAILSGSKISIDKVAEFIPVMKITGNIPYIEAQEDKNAQTKADIIYEDRKNPKFNFSILGGCLRLQGTSSSKYPKKNFRIYTQRKGFPAVVLNYLNEEVPDKLLQFKEGAAPVDCWCLKADYAESSGTHNTGVARLWNEVLYNAVDDTEGYVLRTKAQVAALDNHYPYDVRTTVDGFPIVVFGRENDQADYDFIGKYNFNNDKSTESVFGFCDIPGFDNSKMQCWEVLENGNKYALFQTVEGWSDQQIKDGQPVFDDGDVVWNWCTGFEARYPDDGYDADTTDLFRLANWLVKCNSNPAPGDPEHDPQYDFNSTWLNYFDPWKIAAYYVYLLRFAAVDQVVKNSMLTSEDGLHWYFINYDNDTIAGLKNTGALKYGPDITRESYELIDGERAYIYAGHDSVMWNLLESCQEFMMYVQQVDTLLYRGGDGLTYEKVMQVFNEDQSDKWCQRIYNQDAEHKYIEPFKDTGANNLFMLQGDRKSHREWWFAKRFKLMDGKFNNSHYTDRSIVVKLDQAPGLDIQVTAGEYMYYGCKSNHLTMTAIELQPGESYRFQDDKVYNVGDVISIYAPQSISSLDLSGVSKYIDVLDLSKLTDPVLGNRLQSLILASLDKYGKPVASRAVSLSGLTSANNLETLDIRGIQFASSNVNQDIKYLPLLKNLYLEGSSVDNLELADGSLIEVLQLSKTTRSLKLSNLTRLLIDNIEYFRSQHIKSLDVRYCPDIVSNMMYFLNWSIESIKGDSLTLYGIDWKQVSPLDLIQFGKAKDKGVTLDVKGKITITTANIDQVEEIMRLFGDECFVDDPRVPLRIIAPESVFIHGDKNILSGYPATYDTTVFSESPGTLRWTLLNLENGSLLSESDVANPEILATYGVKSLITTEEGFGVLTPLESTTTDRVIPLAVIHTPSDPKLESKFIVMNITSKKVVYTDGGSIQSITNTIDQVGQTYNFQLVPSPTTEWRGRYKTTWRITTEEGYKDSVEIIQQDDNQCTIQYKELVTFEYRSLIATITNIDSEGNDLNSIEVSTLVTVTDENVLLTSVSNGPVMDIVYRAGWASDPNVFYKSEAEVIQDIGTRFQRTSIKTFKEFKYFTGVLSISDAFTDCTSLTDIKLPTGLQRILGRCFANTGITSITIPATVTEVNSESFDSSQLEQFVTEGSNFRDTDGVLISRNNLLVIYPCKKMDEVYTIPSDVVGIGDYCFRRTQLKELCIPDSVVTHGRECITYNSLLERIQIGSGYSNSSVAYGIQNNINLSRVDVSESHETLASYAGVVYTKNYDILILFPPAKSEFSIKDDVSVIGEYSCSGGSGITNRLDVSIPDSVTKISLRAFNNGYHVRSISFGDNSNLTVIEDLAFSNCGNLTSLELPASVTTLLQGALAEIPKLGIIYCFAVEPPTLTLGSDGIAITFGRDSSSYTGRNADGEKVLHVRSGSKKAYTTSAWDGSLLNPMRNGFSIVDDL